MNKASCLSLVPNAILYWNTIKIGETGQTIIELGDHRLPPSPTRLSWTSLGLWSTKW